MWSSKIVLHHSLKVAGKVTSMDTCGDYLAVGSAVTQLISLSSTEFPRTILSAKDEFPSVCYLICIIMI